MELEDINPDDIFISSGAKKEFTELLNAFAQSLYLLNINLYLLKKIIFFPFHLCGKRGEDRLFFYMVEKNLIEYSVIIARRMFFDPKGWTLKKFKARYYQYLRPEIYPLIDKKLKELKSSRLNELDTRITSLRNKFLAHLDEDTINQTDISYRLSFEDLRYLTESINKYFDALSDLVGIDYEKVPFCYWEESEQRVIHHKRSNDIEQILDNIALDSPLLSLKEEDPLEWSQLETKWSRDGSIDFNLSFINKYRAIRNLPEIAIL